jgi:membrane protease subunit HflK
MKFFGGNTGGSLSAIVLVAVALWFLLGVYQLDQQERAVVLRFGKYHDLVHPGLRWNPRFVDKVHKVNVTKLYSESYSGLMLTRDENIVQVKMSAQYLINGPRDYVLNVRRPIDSLRHAMESALRHVVGGSTIDEVITYGREAVTIAVHERMQNYLNLYGNGVEISQININEASPPQEVKEAFDDVNKALEDEARYINEAQAYANEVVPRARGQAKRAFEEAEAYRQRVIARAEGEASRFGKLLGEYVAGKAVMRERLYIEAVEEVLQNTSKILIDAGGDGSNLFYMPLDQLLRESKSAKSKPGPSTADLSEQDISELARRIANQLGLEVRRAR